MIGIGTNNGSLVRGVKLMDLNGKIVLQKDHGNELDISGLNSGEYFIEFSVGGHDVIRKKIKKP